MIKLTNILSEMKVNKPPMSKKRIFNYFISNELFYTLQDITRYSSLEELMSDMYNIDNIEDFKRETGLSNDTIKYVEMYFRAFQPDEIKIYICFDTLKINFNKSYKTMDVYRDDSNNSTEYWLVFHSL